MADFPHFGRFSTIFPTQSPHFLAESDRHFNTALLPRRCYRHGPLLFNARRSTIEATKWMLSPFEPGEIGGGPQKLDNMLSSESIHKKGSDHEQETQKLQSGIQGQGSLGCY